MSAMVLIGVPKGMEIGLDFHSFKVTESFMGFKDIPDGLHFFSYTWESLPTCSWFLNTTCRDIYVYEWKTDKEDFEMPSEEYTREIISKYHQQDFVKRIAPYPLEELETWNELSKYITKDGLSRIEPIGKRFYPEREKNTIFFTNVPLTPQSIKKEYNIVNPQELSSICLDRSFVLEKLLLNMSENDVLNDLSISFVLFLIGRDYRGFEQWKVLVHMFCHCDSSLIRSGLFLRFMEILTLQLKRAPVDFFIDDISQENFLVSCLRSLFSNTQDNQSLGTASKKMKKWVTAKFKVSFDEEEEDDLPVIVENLEFTEINARE